MVLESANLDPEELPKEVRELPKGVYFGWVQVRGEGLDAGVHKMVMNIGNRPTFADSDATTVVSKLPCEQNNECDLSLQRLSYAILFVCCRKCIFYTITKATFMARMPLS